VRVAWISHRSELAGAEQALCEAVDVLRERGVESLVVLPWEGPLRGRLEVVGARVVVVPLAPWVGMKEHGGRARRVGRTVASLPRLARLLRAERADVVVSNTLVVSGGGPAAALARRPHVTFAHEVGLRAFDEVSFDLGEATTLRAVARLSRIVIANSETVRSYLEQEPRLAGRVRVVSYAVETPERPRRDGGGPLRLVLVASLQPKKGQAEAIRALALLRDRGTAARLRLVGTEENDYGAELRRLAADLGIADAVELTGFTDDPAAELAAADIALTCSRDDAFGRVTVEAMKLGVPVVGADSGGTAELVRDGVTGLLYPPGDVTALVERLVALSADGDLRRALGTAGSTWARATFTREHYAAALAVALEEAAAR